MNRPALLFDLDGTLVDSVYEHVAAWHIAFASQGVTIPAFEYHKRVGMTGEALVEAVNDAFRLGLSERDRIAIEAMHAKEYHKRIDCTTPVPALSDLWEALNERKLRWAIATSADPKDAHTLLKKIDAPKDIVLVTKIEGEPSKPSPSVFDQAAEKLGVELRDSIVVGDAVWDMLASRRAGALGIGVLTGGYGREELVGAGAYRVYRHVGEMARRFTELGL